VKSIGIIAVVLALGAVTRLAAADNLPADDAPLAAAPRDPCRDSILDPVATPVRDVGIDAQRGACLRNEIGGGLLASALIDTPGFHGVLGGGLNAKGRMRIGHSFELDLGLRIFRYQFVQNAVNKVTKVQTGPVTLGAMWAGRLGDGSRVALVANVEIPGTRYEQDTTHVAGELTVVASAAISEATVLHARLGALGSTAFSAGGRTHRFALRAGVDLTRAFGQRLSLAGGADVEAGWYAGLDHVNVRLALHLRLTGPWRGQLGVGLPVGGEERTNAIIALGVVRDLR